MGGTIDGLSTAIGLEITVADGRIEQSNFDGYPLLRMPRCAAGRNARAAVRAAALRRRRNGHSGRGSRAGQRDLTPATGKRLRNLPLRKFLTGSIQERLRTAGAICIHGQNSSASCPILAAAALLLNLGGCATSPAMGRLRRRPRARRGAGVLRIPRISSARAQRRAGHEDRRQPLQRLGLRQGANPSRARFASAATWKARTATCGR